MSTKARRVGGDWVESVDPKSGKVYYANMKTKETSWLMPDEVKQYQEKKARQASKSVSRSSSRRSRVSSSGDNHHGSSSRGRDHSREHKDRDHHRGQSKDRLGGTKDSHGSRSASKEPSTTRSKPKPPKMPNVDQWLERQDPRSGKVYYYNPKLKQTSWTRPDKAVTASSDPNYGKGAWVDRVDPRTNRTFYFNTVTKVTSWTNPDEEAKSQKPPKPERAKRVSKRISTTPDDEDQPAYEATPSAPTNRTSARTSIRLGAIPSANEKGNRLSLAEAVRAKNAEITGDIVEEAQTEPLVDRFAKLRALRERAHPDEEIEEDDVKDEQINLEDLTAAALNEVDYTMNFLQYAQTHFNLRRKGGLLTKKNVNVEELASWESSRIKAPLHGLSDAALVHDSILAFGNIQCYMGDKSTKNPMVNANKIFRITVACPEELRDEVYSQLVKQTTRNPNPSSCVRGWELIVFCAGLFPPSTKLEKYLLSYIKQATEEETCPGVPQLAEYAMLRMQRTIEIGPRNEVPTDIELQSVRQISPVTIRVHMLDGSITPMQAECWTTVADLSVAMGDVLRINDPTPFGLFEINNMDEERALDDDDRILDVIAYWERERKLAKRARDARSYQFVYKVRLFFDIKEDDVNAIEVAYHQAVHDVTDSRYPCSEEDCLRLAALQAQQRFGDCDGSDVFGGELSAFLPAKYYHRDVEDALKSKIMETYELLRGYDAQEAMNNYLDYVKAWKIYGSAYFFVEPQNARAELPPDVVLAVNAQGILIVDPATKEFVAEYPYSEIVTWGHSSVTFVLVVGNLIRQQKLYFKTDQGNEINSLIHAYVNRLVES